MPTMQGLYTEGNYQDVKIDRVDGNLITQDAQHNHIHEGRHFYSKWWFDWVGSKGSKLYMAWVTPKIEPICEIYGKLKCSGKMSLLSSMNAEIEGGTPTVGLNNDLNRTNIHSELKGYEDPTVLDPGIQAWSGVADAAQPMVVSSRFNYGVILRQDNTVLWTFEKLVGAPIWVDIDFWWYELWHSNRWLEGHYGFNE